MSLFRSRASEGQGRGEDILVGLDIGTTKICCIIAVPDSFGGIEIIGVGNSKSLGMTRGMVVNMDLTIGAIKEAVEEASRIAGCRVEDVYLGIAGGHIHSFNTEGVIAVRDKVDKIITEEDKKRVQKSALVLSTPVDRDVFQSVAQEYVVDGQDGILDPVGMVGVRLEVKVHVITGAISAIQNLLNCVANAGFNVNDIILESLASASAVLSPQEMDVGAAILDFGGGTTDIAIFSGGAVKHTAVLALGGNSLTSDLAQGLRTSTEIAEILKISEGCCMPELMAGRGPIEVPSASGFAPQEVPADFFANILGKRVEEILYHVSEEFRRSGLDNSINGIVLTGGSSLLNGVTEMAKEIFNRPVRRGCPECGGGLAEMVHDPKFATAIGLILYGLQNSESAMRVPKSDKSNPSLWGRIWRRLKGMLDPG
ncbi:MAG: cell division protein FtsA [Deltaproteobacteria bacterium]|jgi:cell division protein FtsA|nr:cell division protein FtsA [Deltaproteobacteria bacterium]